MRCRGSLLIAVVALLLFQPAALATTVYTGNSYTSDLWDDHFYANQRIDYYAITGGVHTTDTQLYIDVLTGFVDCGYGAIDRSGGTRHLYYNGSPFPLDFGNTPIWFSVPWNEDDYWVNGSGGYVKWSNLTWKGGPDGCNGFNVYGGGGWISTLAANGQWNFYHDTH